MTNRNQQPQHIPPRSKQEVSEEVKNKKKKKRKKNGNGEIASRAQHTKSDG